jgi:hypothetical protein
MPETVAGVRTSGCFARSSWHESFVVARSCCPPTVDVMVTEDGKERWYPRATAVAATGICTYCATCESGTSPLTTLRGVLEMPTSIFPETTSRRATADDVEEKCVKAAALVVLRP